jgi:pimeloyl-ACP methyl ester carboxylesterase
MANAEIVGRFGLRRIISVLVLVAAVLVVCAALYEQIGAWRDSRRFPRKGYAVKAAGTTFNLNCSGSARPTVLLESGLGMSSLGWVQIQPQIAKFARVCSYDRAGYGWSDPAKDRRTSLQLAKELKQLLNAAGESGPYILVGPSFGGFIARVYTGLYPADVGGLVFLDASHEDQQIRIDEIIPGAKEQRIKEEEVERSNERRALMLSRIKIPLGIERFQSVLHSEKPEPEFGLSADLFGEFNYLDQQLKTREAVAAESASMWESGQIAKASGNLGDRPTVVITGGKMEFTPDPLYTKDVQEKLRNLWINVLQVEESRLSSRGRQVVLRDSGHVIQFERPDAVIESVREVWSECWPARRHIAVCVQPLTGRID